MQRNAKHFFTHGILKKKQNKQTKKLGIRVCVCSDMNFHVSKMIKAIWKTNKVHPF